MFFKNQIDIEGRLCQTPALLTSKGGVEYSRFSICHNQSRKDRITEEWINTPHFFNCVTFKTLAKQVSELKKGDAVTIGGVLQYSTYNSREDGSKRTSISILVNSVKKLDIKKKTEVTSTPKKSKEEKAEEKQYYNESDFYDNDTGIPF